MPSKVGAQVPRVIHFVPFEPDHADNSNHTPGTFPLSWFNITEFCHGKLTECFDPSFEQFQNGRASRMPAWELQLISRILSVSDLAYEKDGTTFKKNKGCMISEFDCPVDAWFYRDNSNCKTMPYSILMEIALQTSGFLSAYLGCCHLMTTSDPLFRNLDCTANFLNEKIDLRGKTIKNVTHAIACAHLGDQIIHRFKFQLSTIDDEGKDEVFYTGETSFGWFLPSTFDVQIGLDNGTISAERVEFHPPCSIYIFHNCYFC